MTDIEDPASGTQPPGGSSFPALIAALTRWRKFLVLCVMISAVLSLAVAFLIPVKYKSSASVFPAEKADLFGSLEGISSLVKGFSPGKGLAALKGDTELDRYLAILKSGRVLGAVIDSFDLVHVYDITSYPREKTTKELLDNVEFTAEDEGDLVVTVYDRDPNRAAAMANYFIDELNRTNSDLMAANAVANRKFIETRYNKNSVDLAAAEDSLRIFQKRYGVVAMPEQTQASIKAGAELAAQLALKEVQLNVQERTQSPDHPAVVATRIEIEELRKKIASMNSSGTGGSQTAGFLVPFSNIPDLGAEYLRHYRDVEIQYKILQFLTPLYEQSKVEERRQTPSVLVLDRAYPAERKSKPKRSLIVLGGTILGLLGAISYIGIVVHWNLMREANAPAYVALSGLLAALSGDRRAFLRKISARSGNRKVDG